MDQRRIEITLAVLGALITVTLVACGGGSEAKDLLENRCQKYHTMNQIEKASKSPELWQVTVDRMIQRGAVLDDAERDTLIQHPAESYP